MDKLNQNGGSGLIFAFVLCVILLISSVVFGYWAFSSRQDYKNNVDAKINVAVNQAVKKEDIIKDTAFAEQAKNPLTTFNGPSQFGSINIQYPKTWSAYVDETGSGSALLDGYFNPGFVPSITAQSSQFALRVQVVSQQYSQVLQSFSGQQALGKIKASAFALKKVPSVLGIELSGVLNAGNTVSQTMVALPLRSNTLEIYTSGNTYLNDFNNYILPNFSFSP